MSIEITNISKDYGAQKALNEVTLTIEKGQITGLLGPNGAGKSTLMKIITGAILPSSGTAVVNGVDVIASPLEVQRSLGYLPEHNPQYLELYVREYLEYVAQLYKVDKERIPTVIEQTVLGPEQHKKIGSLWLNDGERPISATFIASNTTINLFILRQTSLTENYRLLFEYGLVYCSVD